ncbi:hypothetical protein CDEF62S_03603 [Castellaniella defragrans]
MDRFGDPLPRVLIALRIQIRFDQRSPWAKALHSTSVAAWARREEFH